MHDDACYVIGMQWCGDMHKSSAVHGACMLGPRRADVSIKRQCRAASGSHSPPGGILRCIRLCDLVLIIAPLGIVAALFFVLIISSFERLRSCCYRAGGRREEAGLQLAQVQAHALRIEILRRIQGGSPSAGSCTEGAQHSHCAMRWLLVILLHTLSRRLGTPAAIRQEGA